MSNEQRLPDFDDFSRWLSAQFNAPAEDAARYQTLLTAARAARTEFVEARRNAQSERSTSAPNRGHLETLQLLAAADRSSSPHPPELTTARGFRVTLAYDDGDGPESSSICVLVRCPPELIETVQGETAFLWNGSERFELGQFDSEGKAIGTLPAGIEISLSDFALGKVKLEEPPPTSER